MDALVSTDWLAAELGAEDLRVFDCSVHLRPSAEGELVAVPGLDEYNAGHIPGAAFLDLINDFSRADSPLQFTLQDSAALTAACQRAGISNTSRVVLYATNHPMWATRIWWMLTSAGHPSVAVLDGGWHAWTASNNATSTEPESFATGDFTADIDPSWWADKSHVEAVRTGAACTINALTPEFHRGEAPVAFGRPGHISGSVNVPYAELLDERMCLRPASELRAVLEGTADLSKPIVTYCGGGIAATLNGFALRQIGHPDVRVYDGSLSEWGSDPNAAMETGGQRDAELGRGKPS